MRLRQAAVFPGGAPIRASSEQSIELEFNTHMMIFAINCH
jgi:hypothetical protein